MFAYKICHNLRFETVHVKQEGYFKLILRLVCIILTFLMSNISVGGAINPCTVVLNQNSVKCSKK